VYNALHYYCIDIIEFVDHMDMAALIMNDRIFDIILFYYVSLYIGLV
jgi:hypothetical protein